MQAVNWENKIKKSELYIFNFTNDDNVTLEIYWFTFKNLLVYSDIPVIISRARSKLI